MADSHNVLATVLSGGVGATIGGVITAVIQTLSRHGESRATAADLVSKAAGSIVARLEAENQQLRHAVLLLIDALEQANPELSTDIAKKLLEARQAAERAIL